MSGKTWVVADLHLEHPNIVNFHRQDGSKLRPWDSYEEHDQALIQYWNELVAPQDRVYLLGDIVIRRKGLYKLGQLQGRKVLVKGNHDIFKLEDYLPYFDDIRAYVVGKMRDGEKRYVLSHVPVHPNSLIRFGINIHGHLHSGFVVDDKGLEDKRYKCVSLEHTNWRPIELSGLI
jgi:calcineurin-like phosphoesterase family protein